MINALRGTGRKVYDFGLHWGSCPYTRGTYDRWDGPSGRFVAIECSERCADAHRAILRGEAWLRGEGK